MSRTGTQLLQGFSEFVDDWFASTTTSAGTSTGTTIIDTALKQFGENRLQGRFIHIPATPVVRRISSNTQASGTATVAEPFASQIAGSTAYQLHRYDPAKKFLALDKTRLAITDNLFQIKLDDTITADGLSFVYDIPPAMEQGPHIAYMEQPLAAEADWNHLSNPQGNSLTDWTASSTTASIVTRNNGDLLIPKYDLTCTKLVTAAGTAGTYTQAIADMINGVTAASAADRGMTFAMWVYCTEASKVQLRILDDSGTVATGAFHQGRGWELLFVEGTIAGNNATTLSARLLIANTANASTIYWNRAWFYFGSKERVCDAIYNEERVIRVRRDDTSQHILLASTPLRGYQIRLAGKAPLTSLGSTPSTQLTNSMEVDEKSEQVLYAYAAELLFLWEGIKADSSPEVIARIQNVKARTPGLERAWSHAAPQPYFRSPYAR